MVYAPKYISISRKGDIVCPTYAVQYGLDIDSFSPIIHTYQAFVFVAVQVFNLPGAEKEARLSRRLNQIMLLD